VVNDIRAVQCKTCDGYRPGYVPPHPQYRTPTQMEEICARAYEHLLAALPQMDIVSVKAFNPNDNTEPPHIIVVVGVHTHCPVALRRTSLWADQLCHPSSL
jgi:hypothetical protein